MVNTCPQETITSPARERVWEVNPDRYERIRRTRVVWYNGWTFDCTGEWSSQTPDFLSLAPYEDEFYIVMYEPAYGWWTWARYQEEPLWLGE